jgi:hypothetical protein
MLFRKIITVYVENNMKILGGENAEFIKVKADGVA